MKKIWQYIQYLAARAVSFLVGTMPRSWYFPISRGAAHLLMLFPQMGKVSLQNLAAVFPEKSEAERRKIALGSLANLTLMLCEFFWIREKNRFLPDYVEIDEETRNFVENLRRDGKHGMLFFTPHHGNWEFAGMMLALALKFPVSTVVRSPQNPYIGRILSGGRAVGGIELIHSKGAARGILAAIRKGRSIGLLIDQNTRTRDGGIFVNFFGLPVPVTALPAHLAIRNDLTVAVGGCRHEGKRLLFHLHPLDPPSGGAYADDEALTQAIIARSEEIIRRAPEQYLWMYKRFQYIPRDAGPELAKKYPPYAKVADEAFYDQRARRKKYEENQA